MSRLTPFLVLLVAGCGVLQPQRSTYNRAASLVSLSHVRIDSSRGGLPSVVARLTNDSGVAFVPGPDWLDRYDGRRWRPRVVAWHPIHGYEVSAASVLLPGDSAAVYLPLNERTFVQPVGTYRLGVGVWPVTSFERYDAEEIAASDSLVMLVNRPDLTGVSSSVSIGHDLIHVESKTFGIRLQDGRLVATEDV